MNKVNFAERISNSYTGKEYAYQLMSEVYRDKSLLWSPFEEYITACEKLALILCLNTGKDISSCEKAAEVLFKNVSLNDDMLEEFVRVNEWASGCRTTAVFNLISIIDFLKAKDLVKETVLDKPFVLARLITTSYIRMAPIEMIYQEIRPALETMFCR